jgi:cellulose synthase (UDP-forming)
VNSVIDFSESYFQLFLSGFLVIIGFLLWAKNVRGLILLLSAILQIRYLFWRGLYTLETTTVIGLTVTLTLYLAEFYGLIQNLFFYYQIKIPFKRSPRESEVYPTVDIFVPIVNEPIEILKRTLIGCLAQDYPKDRFKIHVLDDKGREDVKALAHEFGCNYLRRQERSHAKAGNLNHAFKHTNSELVVIFDVDHVPVRNFLRSIVGFFQDEKVAFVQTPHHFYNPDIFQKNLRLEKEIRNEQDLFFRVIQPGRDVHNSAFFAGSSCVFRRKALEEIGGFLTDTLTEDLHTSLVLHSRGWKSCYLNETLSAGLSAESLKAYLRQRERWAVGAVQTLLKDNPLFKKGLSFSQRLDYFASIYYFFHGIPRIVYLAAPLSFLLFGIPPIVAHPLELIHYFFSYYLSSILVMDTVAKGYRRVFWSDVYETMMSFSLSRAVIKTFFFTSRSTFNITPKGEVVRGGLEWKMSLPHIALFMAILVGIGRGLILRPGDKNALLISIFWALFNILILFIAILSCLERPQRRRLLRLRRRIKCELQGSGKRAIGYTTDISEEGTSVRLEEEFFFPEPQVDIELKSSYGEITRIKAVILRQEKDKEGIIIGMRFKDIDEDTYHSLVRQMYSPPESWVEEKTKRNLARDMMFPILGIIRPWRKGRDLKRLYPRLSLQKACYFIVDGERFSCSTIDVSYSGLSILIKDARGDTYKFEDARVEINGIELKVTVVAMERIKNDIKLHLKVKTIEKGEKAWKTLSLPS